MIYQAIITWHENCYCFHFSLAALFFFSVSVKPGTEVFFLLKLAAGGMIPIEREKRHPCQQLHLGLFFIPSIVVLLKYGRTALLYHEEKQQQNTTQSKQFHSLIDIKSRKIHHSGCLLFGGAISSLHLLVKAIY